MLPFVLANFSIYSKHKKLSGLFIVRLENQIKDFSLDHFFTIHKITKWKSKSLYMY